MRGHSKEQQKKLPAIAPRNLAEHGSTSQSELQDVHDETHGRRGRPTPRSRNGCWTCRTRKVKCDEQKPGCGQCVRLGYTCDYNPRLAFKDDTPRIVERMQQDVSSIGNAVWDPDAHNPEQRRENTVDDLLPPFALLLTDEERETKAKSKNPGTFLVVTNPDTFASLPEYQAESSSAGQNRGLSSPGGDYESLESAGNVLTDRVDPHVVILKKFDDSTRRGPPSVHSRSATNPASPASSTAQTPPLSIMPHSIRSSEQNASSPFNIADSGGRDALLLQHYRAAISTRIFDNIIGRDGDLFEKHAEQYPPLFHAILALSALNMAHHNGGPNADALEHYQQVIPALKATVQSSQDSYSDGPFLCHFLLLLYEIEAAEAGDSFMFQHHINQLLRIVISRRESNADEKYDFIIWTICSIDVYAILSFSGDGLFIQALLEKNILPSPATSIPAIDISQSEYMYPEEEPYLPALYQLHQEVTLMALKVGQTAKQLRSDFAQRLSSSIAIRGNMFLLECQTRVDALRHLMYQSREAWQAQFPGYWTWLNGLESLPPRAFASLMHSYMLLRACTIYTHTSMFPGQLRSPAPDFSVDIDTCTKEIIRAAQLVLSDERSGSSFLLFPLFMVGVFSTSAEEKILSMNLIKTLEHSSCGATAKSARELLEDIHQKQHFATMQFGDAESLDWVEEIAQNGKGLILFGLLQ